MTRQDLTLPLRIGPKWFGRIMLVVLTPLIIVHHFMACAAEFGVGIYDDFIDVWKVIDNDVQ